MLFIFVAKHNWCSLSTSLKERPRHSYARLVALKVLNLQQPWHHVTEGQKQSDNSAFTSSVIAVANHAFTGWVAPQNRYCLLLVMPLFHNKTKKVFSLCFPIIS